MSLHSPSYRSGLRASGEQSDKLWSQLEYDLSVWPLKAMGRRRKPNWSDIIINCIEKLLLVPRLSITIPLPFEVDEG